MGKRYTLQRSTSRAMPTTYLRLKESAAHTTCALRTFVRRGIDAYACLAVTTMRTSRSLILRSGGKKAFQEAYSIFEGGGLQRHHLDISHILPSLVASRTTIVGYIA